MDNPIIKGKCFFCEKVVYLKLKTFMTGFTAYICPNCNASNSQSRIKKDIEKGTARKIA